MEKYIEMIKDDQHVNAEISKIMDINTLKIYKLSQIKKLYKKYTTKRAISQIGYYCQNLKSSIYKTITKLALLFWFVFIILFTSYRIREVIHEFIK